MYNTQKKENFKILINTHLKLKMSTNPIIKQKYVSYNNPYWKFEPLPLNLMQNKLNMTSLMLKSDYIPYQTEILLKVGLNPINQTDFHTSIRKSVFDLKTKV